MWHQAVSALSILLTVRFRPVLAAVASVEAPAVSLQSECTDDGNSSRTSNFSTCESRLDDRLMPTSWPTPSRSPHGIDQWTEPTQAGLIPGFPKAQLRFHPQATLPFSSVENRTVHTLLDYEILKLEREKLKKGIVLWQYYKRKPLPHIQHDVGYPYARHFLLELSSGGSGGRAGTSKPLSKGDGLALLKFLKFRMSDPMFHHESWGTHTAWVEIWKDYDAFLVRDRKYKGSFRLVAQTAKPVPSLKTRASNDTVSPLAELQACEKDENLTSASNRSFCVGPLGSPHIQMPKAWPEPRTDRPGEAAHQLETGKYPTFPGLVPDYPRAELRFRPMAGIPITYAEVIGIEEAFRIQIRKIETMRRKAGPLKWVFQGRKAFQSFDLHCGPSGGESGSQEHAVLELSSHLPPGRPCTEKPITNSQALAILRFFQSKFPRGPTLPESSQRWSPHQAGVEIWENYGDFHPKDRIFRGGLRLYKVNVRNPPTVLASVGNDAWNVTAPSPGDTTTATE